MCLANELLRPLLLLQHLRVQAIAHPHQLEHNVDRIEVQTFLGLLVQDFPNRRQPRNAFIPPPVMGGSPAAPGAGVSRIRFTAGFASRFPASVSTAARSIGSTVIMWFVKKTRNYTIRSKHASSYNLSLAQGPSAHITSFQLIQFRQSSTDSRSKKHVNMNTNSTRWSI